MLEYLTDGVFSLAITDGKDLFTACDVLGIKTLFYGWEDGTLYPVHTLLYEFSARIIPARV